jgi:hypothetical protein
MKAAFDGGEEENGCVAGNTMGYRVRCYNVRMGASAITSITDLQVICISSLSWLKQVLAPGLLLNMRHLFFSYSGG